MRPADRPSRLLHLLLIAGLTGAVNISIGQSHVTGDEGSSVLLSTTYNTSQSLTWIHIRWTLDKAPPVSLAACTIRFSEDGLVVTHFPPGGYERRMRIVPENGSLIIYHLQRKDAGRYQVEVVTNKATASSSIIVTVRELENDEMQVRKSENEGLDSTWNTTEDGNQTNERRKSSPCICNSAGLDLSTSAWILLGSRLSSVVIALSVLRLQKKK